MAADNGGVPGNLLYGIGLSRLSKKWTEGVSPCSCMAAIMSPRIFKQKGSRVYRGRYRLDDDLKIYDIPLHIEIKEVAEAKLRPLVNEKEGEAFGLLPPKKLREAAKLPLESMLAEFVADLAERKRCEDHVRHNRERLTALFSKCRWRLLRDVTSGDFIKWRSQSPLSAKTKNEYRRRHHIENFFCRIKRFRRISTRYDKLSFTFFSFVLFAAILDWLTHRV